MSTPNPVLKAAAPTLITAITELQSFLNTVLTGDPATLLARVGPASQILLGQLQLLLPGLAIAEIGAVNTDVQTKLSAIVTQLKAL